MALHSRCWIYPVGMLRLSEEHGTVRLITLRHGLLPPRSVLGIAELRSLQLVIVDHGYRTVWIAVFLVGMHSIQLGSSVALRSMAGLGSSLSALRFFHLGASLALRSLAHYGSSSVIGVACYGSSFEEQGTLRLFIVCIGLLPLNLSSWQAPSP